MAKTLIYSDDHEGFYLQVASTHQAAYISGEDEYQEEEEMNPAADEKPKCLCLVPTFLTACKLERATLTVFWW